MNGVDDRDALSESALRRALRLEPDERVPRLDATAIAAAAEQRTVLERVLRVTRGVALVGVSVGVVAVVGVAAFMWLASVDVSDLFGFGLSVVALAAERLLP